MSAVQKNVIIVSPGDDLHALAVRHRIQVRYGAAVAVTIFDSATSPMNSTIGWSSWSENGVFEANIADPLAGNIGPRAGDILRDRAGKSTPLLSSSIHATWLRRPRDGIIHPEVEIPEHRDFAADSVKTLLRSFLEAANTYNPYFAEWRANQKPFQLWSARRIGLAIPRTLITSIPEQAKAFYLHLHQQGAECVYKRIGTSRGFDFATRLFDEHALDRLDSLRFAPIIMQDRIAGGPNIRVAVAGSHVFAAEWRSENQAGDPVDIRDDEGAKMWQTELPAPTKGLLLRLHQELGLVYGIYDLKVGAGGDLYFLEVNPSGQWLDLEYQARLPVSEAWACVLVEGRDAARSSEQPLLTPESLDRLGADVEQAGIGWVRYV